LGGGGVEEEKRGEEFGGVSKKKLIGVVGGSLGFTNEAGAGDIRQEKGGLSSRILEKGGRRDVGGLRNWRKWRLCQLGHENTDSFKRKGATCLCH